MLPDFGEQRAQFFRERNTSALDAHEDNLAAGLIALRNLVRDAREGALNCLAVEDDGGISHWKKAPNSKFQAPEKFQTSNPNLNYWNLELLWSLELGAWNFWKEKKTTGSQHYDPNRLFLSV
jgi:hypothetical protein